VLEEPDGEFVTFRDARWKFTYHLDINFAASRQPPTLRVFGSV
jgi:hypothetical protein